MPDAGASKTHAGKAEASVDQQVVKNEIESVDDKGNHHGCSGVLDASEKAYCGEEEKGKRRAGDANAEVS